MFRRYTIKNIDWKNKDEVKQYYKQYYKENKNIIKTNSKIYQESGNRNRSWYCIVCNTSFKSGSKRDHNNTKKHYYNSIKINEENHNGVVL